MNPQTQSRSMDQDPGTPVIVKTGGNTGNGGDVPLIISSPNMPFLTMLGSTGEGWQKSVSTAAGRICTLEFKDGDLPPYQFSINPRPEVLGSLDVYHTDGTHLFEVREESVNDSIRLHISSSISVSVTSQAESGQGWKESATKAGFSGDNIKIVFKQRNTDTKEEDIIVEHTFSSPVFTVTIQFPTTCN
jgi:hypothetical protein